MSCDSRRNRAWRAIAQTEQVRSRLSSEVAEKLLRDAYEKGKTSPVSSDPETLTENKEKTALLMNRMRWLTNEVPAHSKDDPEHGVPIPASISSQAGYMQAMNTLEQIEGRQPPTDVAVREALGRERYPTAEVIAIDLPVTPKVQEVINKFAAVGMSARPAGGCVRDNLIGKQAKDVDLEVYGGNETKLRNVMSSFGHYEEVGKAFGVFKLAVEGEEEPLDISMPRKDSKSGEGHKGIEVEINSNMDPRIACQRRDLTFNAMLHDTELGVTVDYYGGRRDLEEGRIRHVDDSFRDDPLRPMRAVRFAAVYDGKLEPETAEICRSLKSEFKTLPEERIQTEWNKIVVGKAPDAGIRALCDMQWDEFTPEIARNPEAISNSARSATVTANDENLKGEERAQHVYSGICSTMGAEGAKNFMRSIGEKRMRVDLTRKVVNVVAEQNVHQENEISDPQVRALARRLQPASIVEWSRHQKTLGSDNAQSWMTRAQYLGVEREPEKRWIEGRDILSKIPEGMKPGPWTGKMVQDAALAQENGVFRDHNGAQEWIMSNLRAQDRLQV